MKDKLIKTIKKEENFLSLVFVVLALDYIVLFVLETILPGFVMKVFNLNLLLLVILVLWLVLASVGNSNFDLKSNKLFSLTSILIFVLIIISLFFSLYKIDYLVTIIYIILAIISGKLLFDLWRKK
jgi:CDP-diglyceride synthetase